MWTSAVDTPRENSPSRWLLRLALIAFALALGWLDGLGRVDQLIYDRALSLVKRPVPKDVVLVAIDDQAIDELGRWPWHRALHAQLLDRLHGARAVGLDIVFSEPDARHPQDDQLLSEAIKRHGRVVLPIVLDEVHAPTRADLPLASLAQSAAGLGFINVDPDDDGILRRADWTTVDSHDQPWRRFALALLEVGGDSDRVERFLKRVPSDGKLLIPFAGPPGHFQTVSYLSVLRGEVPPEVFKDKYVVVGAWATGLGDTIPTPVSHDTNGMSGIEIIGNLLQSAHQNLVVWRAPPWMSALFSALPVLLLGMALPRLSPRQAFLCSLAFLGLVLISAIATLRFADIWIPPLAGLIGVAVSYPIWSWRSQEAALRYMTREMKRLRIEYPPVYEETAPPPVQRIGRSLDQHVQELDRTLTHVRNLRRFVADGLDGMPDATMVLDQNGRLQYRNHSAATYFAELGIRPPRIGQTVEPALVQAFEAPRAQEQIAQALRRGTHRTPAHEAVEGEIEGEFARHGGIEVRDRADHDLLMRCLPFRTARGAFAGTVVTISDISAVRRAERQREQMLQFISHDMRAPQNSILALVELHRQHHPATDAQGDVLGRIAHLANRTLGLVDSFVELTRAESMRIACERVDLAAVLHEVVDDFWAAAQSRRVLLQWQSCPTIAMTYGDGSLITRAVCNLLGNAIKYSPDGSTVALRLTAKGTMWHIDIEDAGPGISPQDQEMLFEPFFRSAAARESNSEGSGLGLAFVQTIAHRHNGRVAVKSELGKGSRFTLCLPIALEDEIDH
ncbi:CHASE2 domain-containing protein [Bordetella sp. 02P26C-1]|uniref:CHASE2 domain-containing protein n=1 Tax=Bordetella sp. 02P26C-1 TaxID=2683195 RepID=UPI0013528158|nr:CHASE2 domain-containing protein [Bordetella sp. 02P26C-1]MVW80774.1 CHASE2 domain-containing protein [Bordetella sp. 02P26C-1]